MLPPAREGSERAQAWAQPLSPPLPREHGALGGTPPAAEHRRSQPSRPAKGWPKPGHAEPPRPAARQVSFAAGSGRPPATAGTRSRSRSRPPRRPGRPPPQFPSGNGVAAATPAPVVTAGRSAGARRGPSDRSAHLCRRGSWGSSSPGSSCLAPASAAGAGPCPPL